MSIYIHIPFCTSICSYCDFCKFLYNEEWVNKYLIALEKEIKTKYNNEIVKTIYIGGGTPSSLNSKQLNKLFDIVKIFNVSNEVEFTFECNIEHLSKEKLEILYNNKVNRLSIGVQSFNSNYLKLLNRNHTKEEVIERINLGKNMGFSNISIDLIYALENQTMEDLNTDIDLFLMLDIKHISTYSLMIEPNTQLYIDNKKNINQDIDFDMYSLICKKLEANGYNHYEISNFSKEGYESKHNLTYWNNEFYYGFGLGASGYINNIRYDNTRSFNNYINGKYLLSEKELDINEIISNEFILGLRKIDGINKIDFYNKYNKNITDYKSVLKFIGENKLIDNGLNVFINPKYVYTSNDVLIEFL